MAGLYAADGSWNVTVVTGSAYVGLYAADGSINVIKAPGGSYAGLFHPCGAYYVTVSSSALTSRMAPDGSLYVSQSPYTDTGAQRVTVVSGSLTPGGNDLLLLIDNTSHLLLANGTDRLIILT